MYEDKQETYDNLPLLKPADIAKRLQISRSLAYQLMQTGELPCVKIRSAVRVRECDLQAFIQEHKTGIN